MKTLKVLEIQLSYPKIIILKTKDYINYILNNLNIQLDSMPDLLLIDGNLNNIIKIFGVYGNNIINIPLP